MSLATKRPLSSSPPPPPSTSTNPSYPLPNNSNPTAEGSPTKKRRLSDTESREDDISSKRARLRDDRARKKSEDAAKELLALLNKPTAKDRLIALATLPSPLPPFTPLCPHTTLQACKNAWNIRFYGSGSYDQVQASGRGGEGGVGGGVGKGVGKRGGGRGVVEGSRMGEGREWSCPHPHFEPIIRRWTEPSLGQCSYLNMCYGDPLFTNNPSLLATSQPPTNPKQCRYQHYRLVPPKITSTSTSEEEAEAEEMRQAMRAALSEKTRRKLLAAPEAAKGLSSALTGGVDLEREKQWLNMDVRKMDPEVLGLWDAIIADPPWDIHMNLPYQTLQDDDMRSLTIPLLQPTWGLLALWVTGRAMEVARELISGWGYRRIDEPHLRTPPPRPETPPFPEFPDRSAPIPWETDPRLKSLKRGVDGDVCVSEVRETSRKPDEIYGMFERMVPYGRRLEIFGRKHNTRPGWTTIGNQLDDNRIVDSALKERAETAGILIGGMSNE